MNWLIIFITFGVMLLGFLRVAWWDLRPLPQVNFAKAEQIAQCLVPKGEIPVGTNGTVVQLVVPKGPTALPAAKDRLDFITTGPVMVEIGDSAKRKAAADPANTEKVTLPADTPLSVAKG